MTANFHLGVQWLPPFRGTAELERTSAELTIRVGGEIASRFEDEWSQSVQHSIRGSLYPLALWFAHSWWRIRWEPVPSRIRLSSALSVEDADWKMSHEMPAAGGGFIWPPLTFSSDGEGILVTCRPSPALSGEPVKYLSDFNLVVAAADFETEVDAFIDLILRRLDVQGTTELHVLWSELLAERGDPRTAALRRTEARLGYDPDEANPELLQQFLDLGEIAGEGAVDEIAPVCSGANPEQQLQEVLSFSGQPGLRGEFALLPEEPLAPGQYLPPVQRGKTLAKALRTSLGVADNPLEDSELASLLSIDPNAFLASSAQFSSSPLGLAKRVGNSNEFDLLLRKRNRYGRRFEAARCIADFLFHSADRWHPLADTATARQKMQRAFAAEFLCPIESLKNYLGAEFLPESIENAADHFGISEVAIRSHLANNHLIPRTFVDPSVAAA
jgi:hypothetical protein